ncbi:hypothetical protein KIF59_23160 [Enterobacter cloacae subsp. cloacae]|nr:hypothetical protein [Enterobacter cloacae subsp. cloacae]
MATSRMRLTSVRRATRTIVVDTTVSDAFYQYQLYFRRPGASDTDFITSDNTLLINGQLTALQADEWS